MLLLEAERNRYIMKTLYGTETSITNSHKFSTVRVIFRLQDMLGVLNIFSSFSVVVLYSWGCGQPIQEFSLRKYKSHHSLKEESQVACMKLYINITKQQPPAGFPHEASHLTEFMVQPTSPLILLIPKRQASTRACLVSTG